MIMNSHTISVSELQAAIEKQDDFQLVDVRTIEKHQAFNIGGKHIPSDELITRLNELDQDKLIVTYCSTGGRSMRALQLLLSNGFTKVKSLTGGMTAWQESLASK